MFFVEIFHDFGWFFATRIRIWLTKMKRIQTDPDPKHCCKVTVISWYSKVLARSCSPASSLPARMKLGSYNNFYSQVTRGVYSSLLAPRDTRDTTILSHPITGHYVLSCPPPIVLNWF